MYNVGVRHVKMWLISYKCTSTDAGSRDHVSQFGCILGQTLLGKTKCKFENPREISYV